MKEIKSEGEQEKEYLETSYKILFERVSVGLFRTTPDGKFIDANPALVEMIGYPDLDSLLQVPIISLFHDPQEHINQRSKLEKCDHLPACEFRLKRLDGRVIWVRDKTSVVRDDRGNILYYQGSLEDVTERKMIEALQQVSLIIGSTPDFKSALGGILEQVGKVIPFDIGSIILVDTRSARIACEFRKEQANTQHSIDVRQNIQDINQATNLKQIIDTGKPLIIEDTSLYHGKIWPESWPETESWLGVPIHIQGVLIALFSLFKNEKMFYNSDHAIQLSAFAGQTALALQNAKLFESARKRAKEAQMLRQAAAAVVTELDLDQVLDRILSNLKMVVHFDRAAIYLLEDDQLKIVAGRGFPNDFKFNSQSIPADNQLFRLSLTTGKPMIIGDADTDPSYQSWGEPNSVHGWIGIPLHLRGRAIGFITISSNKVNEYTESEATLAQAFANEVTIALENARLFKELQTLATIDPLTEIWNRRHFIHLAKIEFQRAHRSHTPLSLVLFDIDNFKHVNDTYGHPAGDEVLRGVAKLCRNNLRQVDIIGRYGGEEFMVVLPNTPKSNALHIAERLRNLISSYSFETDSGPVRVSASFGIAEMDSQCPDIDTLLKYADRATYNSKNEGKNRVSS